MTYRPVIKVVKSLKMRLAGNVARMRNETYIHTYIRTYIHTYIHTHIVHIYTCMHTHVLLFCWFSY